MDDRRALILVVEDDFTARLEVSTLLFKNGFNVICAENGEEAARMMKTCLPDCILLDLLMPKMHGHAFLSQLRKTDRNLPVIVMSAVETQPDLIATIRKLGISGWLSKPFRNRQLLELIAKVSDPENYGETHAFDVTEVT